MNMEKMEILTTVNTAIIVFFMVKPYLERLTIEIKRTFWEKKPYGFYVMKWQYKKGTHYNNGKSIFSFNWINPNNISDDVNKRK